MPRIPRDLLGALLAVVPDGVWVTSYDGKTGPYFNPAVERISGRPLAEFHADPRLWLAVVHPDDRRRVARTVRELQRRGSLEAEYRIVRPDGEVRWVLDRRRVARNARGEPVAAGGIVTDVTDRRRAEVALRESESRLTSALEALEGGVWDWNVQTGEVFFSPRWPRMLGFEPHEIENHVRTWEDRVHPDDRAAVMKTLQEHFDRDVPYLVEHRLKTKRGDWIWVLGRGKVVERDAWNRPLRMTGTNVDITAGKRAEQERRALERKVFETQKLESLGVLAGGIAHDFNTLLTGVLGEADLAFDLVEPGGEAATHLERIRRAADRAGDLCQQLLAYSGKGRFVIKPVDLSELVNDMAQLLDVSISKKAQLVLELDSGLPAVDADVNQLRQVVMNLITNASEALGGASGTITVRSSWLRGEDQVCLEVSDTGCGMDATTRERLFDPFFTTKFTGHGLGLAAVQGIVRAHHATIDLRSRPGHGTTFRILFPASKARSRTLATRAPAGGGWRGTGTILVVDDAETVRLTAGAMLERCGFSVVCARDGRDAVEIFRRLRGQIVAVLLDLMMPRLDGAECLRELRRIDPDVKVILSSGYDESDVSARFGVDGVAGFIQKPYRYRQLTACCREALAGG